MSGYSICSEKGDNLCFLRVHQLRVESVFEFNFILQWCGSQPSIFGMMVHALLFPVFVSTSTFQQSSWPLEMITICGICDMYFANKKKFPFWWWAQNFKYLLMRSFLNVLVDLIKFFVIGCPLLLFSGWNIWRSPAFDISSRQRSRPGAKVWPRCPVWVAGASLLYARHFKALKFLCLEYIFSP